MSGFPYLGDIMIWPANFAPRGWMFCDGRLLSINQNSALYAILGTFYGGDGRNTFALPDLRGRVPLGVPGSAGGCCPVPGEPGGAETFLAAPVAAAAPADAVVTVNALPIAGSAVPTDIRQPYFALNYVIAVEGSFPARN